MKLTDVVDRINGNVDRFNTDLEYYIGGEHFESNELEVTNRGILKENLGKLGFKFRFAFQDRDVVFMARNPHLRKAGMVRFSGLCSDASYILRSKDESKITQEYLAVMLQSNHFWDYCESHKVGSVNFANNWSSIANYEFDLPSIEKQKEISNKVWAAYRLKQAYKKLLAATDEMVKSQFIEMFKNIPSVKIADCCITVSGGTPNTKKIEYYDGGDIPWLSSGEINQGYIFSTDKYITQLGLENSSAKWVPANSVVIAMYGATAGKVGFIKIPLTTNQAVCTLLPNDGFEPLYLYYATLSKTSWMISQCRGAAQPNISQSIIRSMEIPMATIDEQKRFCKLLTQADKSKFGDFKSQFIEMFGDCVNRIKLSSLCSTFVDGDWIESKDQSELGIRLIQTGNVGNGFFKDKEDKSRYISEETFDNLHCTEIYPGDILVSRLPDPIGRACIIPQGLGRTITAVDCTIIRLKDIILPDYFIAYTMTPSYVAQINEVTTGTTRRRVSRANLGNILIPCPSIAKQQQFVAIAKQADKSKSYVWIALKNLESMLGYYIRQVA